MQKIIFSNEIIFDDRTFPINANDHKKQGCFYEILYKMHQQLHAMQSHHCKVLVCMSIFHLHYYTPDNKLFSNFMRKLRKKLQLKFNLARVGYVWVREHGVGESQHYHLALFLDGNKIQSSHKVFELCIKIWEGWNQPRPSYPAGRSYYMLRRGNEADFKNAFYHLSYMAKTWTKGLKPSSTNNYYASRVKPKID